MFWAKHGPTPGPALAHSWPIVGPPLLISIFLDFIRKSIKWPSGPYIKRGRNKGHMKVRSTYKYVWLCLLNGGNRGVIRGNRGMFPAGNKGLGHLGHNLRHPNFVTDCVSQPDGLARHERNHHA